MAKDYKFTHNGQEIWLNGKLIEQQKSTKEDLEIIVGLHRKKLDIRGFMKVVGGNTKLQCIELHKLNDQIREVEFALQDAWGFERNEGYHRHWEVPHCRCPVLDNKDDYPYRKYFSSTCPVHGDLD